jgi:hypothetical protein
MSAPSLRARPTLELLEGRDCPAVSASFAGGVLTVVGDAGPNVVEVFERGHGAVEVNGDGQRFDFVGVQAIHVHTFAGPDKVKYGPASADALPVGDRELTIDVGAGDDRVTVRDHPAPLGQPVTFTATVTADIHLGNGNDYLLTRVRHSDDVHLDVTSADGGDDVDVAMLLPAVQKVRASAARITLDLGAGGNVVTVATENYDDVQLALKTFVSPGAVDPSSGDRFALTFAQQTARLPHTLHFTVKLRAAIDLSDIDDRLTLRTADIPDVATQLATGGGDDQVRIRHRMFPITDRTQLVLAADFGAGDDRLDVRSAGYAEGGLALKLGAGDDRADVQVGSWILDVSMPPTLNVNADLGAGRDVLSLFARGYEDVRADLATGPDDVGADRLAATFVLPNQSAPRRRHLVTSHSMDLVRVLGVGYTTADVSLEGNQCLVFFLGGLPRS